jgi:hypothetical protein
MKESDKKINRGLEEYLKNEYDINFNVSENLSASEKQELIGLIENNECIYKLVGSFVCVNKRLANSSKSHGRRRGIAEGKLEDSEEENNKLSTELSLIRQNYNQLKKMLSQQLEVVHDKLLDDMLERSELIIVLKSLVDSITYKKDKVVK